MRRSPKRFTSPVEGEVDRQRVRPEMAGPMTGSAVGRGV
jgi:hypothetical protein